MAWIVKGYKVEYHEIRTTDFIYMKNHPNWPEQKYISNKDDDRNAYLRGDFNPTQTVVAYAIGPDGTKVKLDGHSRSAAMREGLLKNYPDTLLAVVFVCNTTAELNEILTHFDNKFSTNNKHIVQIIYSELGIKPQSQALVKPTSAIKFAKYGNSSNRMSDNDMRELLSEFRQEIVRMDSLMLDKKVLGNRMVTAITMGAAFKLLKDHGFKALDVIDDFFYRRGQFNFDEIYARIDDEELVVSGGAVERRLFREWLAVFERELAK